MKLKIIALFTLCYMGLSCSANADIYFRNFNFLNLFSKTQVDHYYPEFAQSPTISGNRLQFEDKNGKVDLNSVASDGVTTLNLALKEGYNQLPVISLHTIDGRFFPAAVAISSSFDPSTYVYKPADVLLVTIIDQSDQKKYGVDCRGNNPCAVVEKIGVQSGS